MWAWCFLLVGLLLVRYVESERGSSCINACSRKGYCNRWNTCDCWTGWEGTDCSKRSCPTGPKLADIPYAEDSAHADAQCSGQGDCDHSSGNCKCREGYFGGNCGKTKCFNDCSGKGQCVSLKTAAMENDGFRFNRTTTYTQWDAEVIFGCKCDPGFSGADCSDRVCEYGADPRLDSSTHEIVTFVCNCDNGCGGQFKLNFMGRKFDKWLTPESKASDILDNIMRIPGIYNKNNTVHTYSPVQTANASAEVERICNHGTETRTQISFVRNAGDLPAMSIYANKLHAGAVYFETTQTLKCDCINHACNGTYRVSFDGEISDRLDIFTTGNDIARALQGMSTVKAALVTVQDGFSAAVCRVGIIQNNTITMKASHGNLPRLGLWTSVQKTFVNPPEYYTSANSSSMLRLVTNDGRDDNVKLCNGVGKCDFATGECSCPYGWGFDAAYGICGKAIVNTSHWSGNGRCPGIISLNFDASSDGRVDQSSRANYDARMFLSLNPVDTSPKPYTNYSRIYYYPWVPSDKTVDIDEQAYTPFVTLTSNVSAGPMVIDTAAQRVFFVDANPDDYHIGTASIAPGASFGNKIKWLSVGYKIFGFTMNANIKRRNLYWTVPALYGTADGAIYYANIDETTPTVKSLVAAIGQANLIDPRGIAFHYIENKLYWVDKDSTRTYSVLRSANEDGTGLAIKYLYKTVVENNTHTRTVSVNATDMAIDFQHNNTAIFIDAGKGAPALVATNLDEPVYYHNVTEDDDQFEEFAKQRIIATTIKIEMVEPTYLLLDEFVQEALFTDRALGTVRFARYKKLRIEDKNTEGTAYIDSTYHAVGMAIDRGLGPPQWGNYLDCYGNGRCKGLAGKFECECYKGYWGDCQARTCPTGPAWWHEPVVDEIAHDELAECSNMGRCDRETGRCTCKEGFEGNACERMSCQGAYNCLGNGRCLSLKNLAKQNKNVYGEVSEVPISYGSTPHNPLTWDAEMIYGCAADVYGYFNSDEGTQNITSYEGGGLADRQCPNGFNTRLLDATFYNGSEHVKNYTAYKEIQRLVCSAIEGYVTVSFRGKVSAPVFWNTSQSQFEAILEATPSIGDVSVQYLVPNGRFCEDAQQQYVDVTFESELGAIPLLTVETNTLYVNRLSITRLQQGSTESIVECGGYGECDRTTGLCKCFDYHGTSDGFGGIGTRGDCGHNLIY